MEYSVKLRCLNFKTYLDFLSKHTVAQNGEYKFSFTLLSGLIMFLIFQKQKGKSLNVFLRVLYMWHAIVIWQTYELEMSDWTVEREKVCKPFVQN